MMEQRSMNLLRREMNHLPIHDYVLHEHYHEVWCIAVDDVLQVMMYVLENLPTIGDVLRHDDEAHCVKHLLHGVVMGKRKQETVSNVMMEMDLHEIDVQALVR
jgi:hypothetical protein